VVLALAGVVALVLLARSLAPTAGLLSTAVSDPRRLLRVLASVLGGAGVLLVTAAVVRRVLVGRALRSRVRLELLASEAFDPSIEAVERFAAQLARTRRGAGGWLDRPGSAVRVRLAGEDDGLMHYTLEAPRRALPTLHAALGAYDQLDIRPADTTDTPTGGAVVRAELVLARSSSLPLGETGLEPDLLQSFAAALARLDSTRGERAVVALDLLPAAPGQRRRLRRRLLREASRHAEHHAGVSLGSLLGENERSAGRGRIGVGEAAGRRWQTRALERKLASGGPLFQIQLLLRVQAQSGGGARAGMQALLSCFDALAGENHLRVVGLRLGGLGFLGSDLPWRRARFDRRMRSGRFAPRRRGLVSAGEIAGLLKPPTVHCRAENVARSGGVIPAAPIGLPVFTGQPGVIPLGRLDDGRLVGVHAGETFFAYMAGRSRYGKTETAIGQFVHLARSGHGGMFLDPHADAIAEIKSYLTDAGVRERVVEIDLSDLDRDTPQPGWNLFALERRTPGEAADRVEAFVDALAAALRWDERNTRALNLATQAAQALVELAQHLPAELAPTIFQVPTLLSDPDWREAALPFLTGGTAGFFRDRFPRLPAEAVTAVTNIIDRLRAARPVAALLGAPASSYGAARAMRDGLIVLACPGSGSTRDRLIANLLVYDVLHAAKARAAIAPERRRPFWVFLDELQTYDGPNLPVLLEQSAKYGGRAFLFNQNPERLTDATWNAVTTNRSHLLTTTVNAKAAGMIAREWAGQIQPDVLTRLARYTYLASVTLGERTTKPFLIHGVRARELHAAHHHPEQLPALQDAIDATAHRQPIGGTLELVDRHDKQIAGWLEQHTPDRTHPGANGQDDRASGGARVLHTSRRRERA